MSKRRLDFALMRNDGGFVLTAKDGSAEAGVIEVASDGTVRGVSVGDAFRRQRVGTQLYQHAARIACSRLGVPLRSDSERSGYAQAFWDKQVSKGRARCAGPAKAREAPVAEVVYGRGGCHAYTLKCPPPASLAGRRKS